LFWLELLLLNLLPSTHLSYSNKSVGQVCNRLGASLDDGSCVASVVTIFSSCSGMTNNFELGANHQLLILFSTSVAGLDGMLLPACPNTRAVSSNCQKIP